MAFPSYSGPLKNPFNDISNEDDEFGDFTSAVTYPTIGNCNGEPGFQVSLPVQNHPSSNTKMPTSSVFFNPIPDSSDIDDEFGDFCGPIVANASQFSMVVPATPDSNSNISLPPEGSLKKCQPNYDIDLEEDLTGVSQLSWISQKQDESNGVVEEEEEFTNFTSAEPINCQPLAINSVFSPIQQTPQPIVEDIFSTLGQVSLELPPILQPLDQLTNSKVDDDFGDFTQASSVAELNHPPVVEDLFSLDAVPPFTLDSPGVSSLCFDQQDEMEQPHFAAMSDSTDSPQINWDEPLEVVDPLSTTVCFDVDKMNPLDDAVKVQEEIINQEEEEDEEEFVFHQNVETAEPEFSDFQTEPIDLPVDDGDVEEFGDFTDFQTATLEAVATEDDDEFDDFEAAPQPCTDSAPSVVELPAATPETHIQRMLTTLFPVNSAASTDSELQQQSSTIPLMNSPGGSLWSYVSQLDSTPALSFSWRHSAAQQRFLHSLRIDSVLQAGNAGGFRWNSPPSANSPSASMSESFTEAAVTLDLDFFLNPSSSATAVPVTTAATNNTTSDSILETIERELLSPQGKGLRNPGVAPAPAQSPALPVRHNNHQLSDIFQHLHLQDNATNSSVTNRQVDLLQ